MPAAAVPTSEPAVITAGETLAWTRALPEHPASLWALKYGLQLGTAAPITLAASASGDTHVISVPPATSAGWVPGAYMLTAYVEQGSGPGLIRRVLSVGQLRILPSPLAALGGTHATRMLALIECALERRIPSGLESSDIDGQQLSLIPLSELTRLQRLYQSKVSAEQNALALAAGRPNRRRILTRFRAVC